MRSPDAMEHWRATRRTLLRQAERMSKKGHLSETYESLPRSSEDLHTPPSPASEELKAMLAKRDEQEVE